MPHSRPAKNADVPCSKCIAPNTGKETVGFSDPLFAYAGRYVDSDNTRNVQNVGMRTVRAQRVRVNQARQRIFVKYGETVAAFPIDMFLTNIANPDLWPVGVMKTGTPVNRYGDPVEIVAKPSTFFYAEAKGSGWVTTPQDMQVTLTDFDSDDLGNVFTGSYSWGWGIAWDENDFPDTRQMEFRCQLANAPIIPNSVIFLQPAKVPCVVISWSGVVSSKSASLLVYDVSDNRAPKLLSTRNGKPNGIIVWARNDAAKRLAVVNSDQMLRIYDYAAFLDGGAPLVELTPATKKTFRDLKFDENGTLWAVESGGSPATGNKLWQVTPSGTTYKPVPLDVYGTAFAPERIAARNGWIAVGGQAGPGAELRLFQYTGGKVQFADTKNFFYRYYFDKNPPAGFCSASTYTPSYCSLDSLQMLDWKGKTYLLFSANGLGDVYELKG
jgi:WD40 repeat protein